MNTDYLKNLSENLNLLMAKFRISAEKLGKETGLPAATIKRIRNKANANPTLNTVIPLAEYFSITISELIGDQSLPMDRIDKKILNANSNLELIPLIPWNNSIDWPSNRNGITIIKQIQVESFVNYKDVFALEVDDAEKGGDLISKGSILFIAPNIKPKHRDIALVCSIKSDIPSIKDISFYDDSIYLVPLSKKFPTVPFDETYRFIGVVLQIRLREDS